MIDFRAIPPLRIKDRELAWDEWFAGLTFEEQMTSLAIIQAAQERMINGSVQE